jgi:hypothetical protein
MNLVVANMKERSNLATISSSDAIAREGPEFRPLRFKTLWRFPKLGFGGVEAGNMLR